MDDKKYDIFISYAFCDRAMANKLCAALESRGYKCFIAHRNIPKGAVFSRVIPWAIDKSRMMVALMSQKFNESAHTDREISMAANMGLPIMTVRTEPCEYVGAKKYYLSNVNWVDAFPVFDENIDEVVKAVGDLKNSKGGAVLPPISPIKKKLVWWQAAAGVLAVALAVVLVASLLGKGDPIPPEPLAVAPTSNMSEQSILVDSVSAIDGQQSMSDEENGKRMAEKKRREKERQENAVKAISRIMSQTWGSDSSAISDAFRTAISSLQDVKGDERIKAFDNIIDRALRTPNITSGAKDAISSDVSENGTEYGKRRSFYEGLIYYYGFYSGRPNYDLALKKFENESESDFIDQELYASLCYIKKRDKDFENAYSILSKIKKSKKINDNPKIAEDIRYFWNVLASFMDRREEPQWDKGKNELYSVEEKDFHVLRARMYENQGKELFDNVKEKGINILYGDDIEFLKKGDKACEPYCKCLYNLHRYRRSGDRNEEKAALKELEYLKANPQTPKDIMNMIEKYGIK